MTAEFFNCIIVFMNTGLYEKEADGAGYYNLIVTDRPTNCPHYHRSVEILIVEEGTLTAVINGRETFLGKGDGVFVYPYQVHCYKTERCLARGVVLSENYLADYRAQYCRRGDAYPPNYLDNKEVNAVVSGYFRAWKNSRAVSDFAGKGWSDVVLSELCAAYPVAASDECRRNEFVQKAMTYIDGHYCGKLTLGDLAGYMGYTQSYCSRLFTGYVGAGLKEFVGGMRLRRAMQLIEEGYTVETAAKKCGFSGRSSYYRALSKSSDAPRVTPE